MSLLVVGSVAFDGIETPFGSTDKIIGGAATYISLTASYFTKVNIVSVVGDDFKTEDIAMLERHGINTQGLEIKQGEKSFFWKGRYHADMNIRDTLVTELNVLANFDPQIPESYQDCEYLMLGNLSPVIQRQVIERLRKRPKVIVMDTMNFWIDSMREELERTISMVDILSINDQEARQLSGEYSLLKAARKILKMGIKYLVIKKGEHGALLFDEEQLFWAPALPLDDVFDPTGAGDTFAGGMIGYLHKQNKLTFQILKTAIVNGSALASMVVEKFGPERLINLKDRGKEVDNRIRRFINMMQMEARI